MAKPKVKPGSIALAVEEKETVAVFEENALDYGRLVLEDRSLPDYRDGLLKVYRRTLYATDDLAPAAGPHVKTARIVGEVLGKYHPHGDLPVQSAIESLVWCPTEIIDGSGNWGSQVDKAAAMRYTNLRLSKYGQRNFFSKAYLPTMKMNPNYDGKESEPELLPSLLPNVLLNGTVVGIGVGMSASIPAFKEEGIVKLLKGMLAGKKLTAANCYKMLEMHFAFGGNVPKEDYNEDALNGIFKTGKGSVYAYCDYEIDAKAKTLHITGVPPNKKPDTLMNQLRETEYFSSVQDNMGRQTTTPADILCTFKKTVNVKEASEYLWENLLYTKVHFQIGVVERYWDEEKNGIRANIYQWGVVELLEHWLEWRKELEAKMLACQVQAVKAEIERKSWLLIAQENRKLVADSWEVADQKAFIATKLKVPEEGAAYIVNLRLSQLAKLDRDKLNAEVAALKKELKEIAHYQANIAESILRVL